MDKVAALLVALSLSGVCVSQHIEHPDGRSDHFHTQDYAGNFNFGYDIGRADGSRDARQERGDIYGNVVGSYSLQDVDGRSRVVDYTAGENGFQAVVRTNEPGTANQSPASVVMNSDAPRADYGIGRQGGYRPAPPVRRQYVRPAYRPYRSHYDPHYRGSHGYNGYSHSHYNYDPYYNY